MGKTLNSIHELTVEAMNEITAEHWQGAIRLATKHEAFYAFHDKLELELDYSFEPDIEEMESVEEPLEEPAVTNVKKCPHCTFETESSRSLKLHTKSFKMCSTCLKVFCGQYAKRNHKRHLQKHEKPGKVCNICEKEFKYPSDLKKHMVWTKCGRQ